MQALVLGAGVIGVSIADALARRRRRCHRPRHARARPWRVVRVGRHSRAIHRSASRQSTSSPRRPQPLPLRRVRRVDVRAQRRARRVRAHRDTAGGGRRRADHGAAVGEGLARRDRRHRGFRRGRRDRRARAGAHAGGACRALHSIAWIRRRRVAGARADAFRRGRPAPSSNRRSKPSTSPRARTISSFAPTAVPTPPTSSSSPPGAGRGV